MALAAAKSFRNLIASLSHALVAFTIEFDNEFEHRMPHQTTRAQPTVEPKHGAWLVSMVMWSNLMRLVPEQGAPVGTLLRLACVTKLPLPGMTRWGYVFLEASGGKPSDWVVRPTAKGRRAQMIWQTLPALIEERWQTRFGKDKVDRLRESLWLFANQFEAALPDYLPILHYGLKGEISHFVREGELPRGLDLAALLSKALLAFSLEFDRESNVSIAICANILRILRTDGVLFRDLPRLSGISKEAIQMGIGFLEKQGYVAAASNPKSISLTEKGSQAKADYSERIEAIGNGLKARFGSHAMEELADSLKPFAAEILLSGLKPCAEGWRASLKKPDVLPDYPMVLHRGGYPDGS